MAVEGGIDLAASYLDAAGINFEMGEAGELWIHLGGDLSMQIYDDEEWLGLGVLLVETDQVDADVAAMLVRQNAFTVFGRFVVDSAGADGKTLIQIEHELLLETLDADELLTAVDTLAAAAREWYPRLAAEVGDDDARIENVPSSGSISPPGARSTLLRFLATTDRASNGTGIAPGGVRLSRGFQIDQFRIEGVLGSGGFGTVYRATDTVLGRLVAVKVLNPSRAYTEEARARFLREARLAARVSHPNVVKVFSAGVFQDHPYIAYDYVDGPTLDDLAREEYPLEPRRVSRLTGQLAQGIQALHDVNVVHRDVKPVNALVWGRATDSETALLTDLGIATDPDPRTTRLTRTGSAPGTLPYMAPEALLGPVGPAGDQYSLAVSAYELFVGEPPFFVDTDPTTSELIERKLSDVPIPPSRYVDGLPPPVDAVLLRALSRQPDDRFETVTAFARALDQAIQGVEARTASRAAPTALAPYVSWESGRALPEPLFARIDEIGDGLAEITAMEGPVVCERVFRLYLRGAGRSQLTAELRQRMSRALSALTRSGALLAENEWKTRDPLDRVLRVPSQPEILLRELGPRRLDDVPPREWAAAARTVLAQKGRYTDRDELVRAVAGLYGRQRVAARLHGLIAWSLKQYLQ